MRIAALFCYAILATGLHGISNAAATPQHFICSMTEHLRLDNDGPEDRHLGEFYLIREADSLTIGIVGQFETFSDWVFDISWQKGQKVIANHPDGTASFDGSTIQMATTQLVSGISAVRAICHPAQD